MKFIITFMLLFAAMLSNAQTYTQADSGRVILQLVTENEDGSKITVESAPIDSLQATDRLFNSLVQTNQRIAQIKLELDLLEKQQAKLQKSFRELDKLGKNANDKLQSTFEQNFIGDYMLIQADKKIDAAIKKTNAGNLVLTVEKVNYPIRVYSNEYILITKYFTDEKGTPLDVEFFLSGKVLTGKVSGEAVKLRRK